MTSNKAKDDIGLLTYILCGEDSDKIPNKSIC